MLNNQIPDFRISRGRIAVYTDTHKLINARLYYTVGGMKRIMAEWMNECPSGYYIQVRPYQKGERLPPIRLDILKKDEAKMKRPPSVYTNISTPYPERKNGVH